MQIEPGVGFVEASLFERMSVNEVTNNYRNHKRAGFNQPSQEDQYKLAAEAYAKGRCLEEIFFISGEHCEVAESSAYNIASASSRTAVSLLAGAALLRGILENFFAISSGRQLLIFGQRTGQLISML
ncbi:MAG: hypothetical protein ACXWC4_03005 [Telluria sp.]